MFSGFMSGSTKPRPLRFPMRSVPVHARLNGGDFTHQFGFEETERVGQLSGGGPLMANLHHPLVAGVLVRRAHLLGMLHRERHRLFLVDMLARVQRGSEALRVQVLRRGDQDGVDVLVLQHAVVVQVRLGIGSDLPGLFQPPRVDIGRANALHVFQGQRLAQNLRSARAGPDNSQADAFVRAQHVGSGQSAPPIHRPHC